MKLFSYIYKNCDLLPHFFLHYDALGIKEYYFIVNTWDNEHIKRDVEDFCMEKKVVLRCIHQVFLSQEKDKELENMKNEHSAPDECIMVVDLDEFVDFKMSLNALILFQNLMGYDSVCGTFVDRIAQEGALPPIDLYIPIEKQFPLGADLTKNILLGWIHKVVLMKARLEVKICCHSLEGKRWDGMMHAVIHHYKWNIEVLNRLEERVESFKLNNMGWWWQSERFLEFYKENQRINIDNPHLNTRVMASIRKSKLKDLTYVCSWIVIDIYKRIMAGILNVSVRAIEILI